jgi:hypothetical protein
MSRSRDIQIGAVCLVLVAAVAVGVGVVMSSLFMAGR